MNTENLIKGNNEDEIWQQINEQFLADPDLMEYTAIIEQQNRRVVLNIDIDPGGGFESGFETTSLTARLHTSTSFRFALHHEHFIDGIGKFFGMQDAVIGYEEFDKKLIIKTNEPATVGSIFSEAPVRAIFQSLDNFTFGITTHHPSQSGKKEPYLELIIETGITDTNRLRDIYHAFFSVLSKVEMLER